MTINYTKGERKEKRAQDWRARNTKPGYKEALIYRALDIDADRSSSEIKASIREAIEGR